MGLSPTNCRKVMTACIQSDAMFGSELWWKGDTSGAPWARQMSCSCWLTRRQEQQVAVSGLPTRALSRWNQVSRQRQRS